MNKQIWQVRVDDANYRGNSRTYLLRSSNVGQVEKKALALAKHHNLDLAIGEKRPKPYVSQIQLIGSLDD